jgi:hypothetical protein
MFFSDTIYVFENWNVDHFLMNSAMVYYELKFYFKIWYVLYTTKLMKLVNVSVASKCLQIPERWLEDVNISNKPSFYDVQNRYR